MDIFGNSNENGGDIIGPASSTTNALVRYADTTGKLLKNSTVTLSDAGDLTGLNIITPATGQPLRLYGDLDMGQNFIIDLATPVNDFDAVTKEYVDGKAGNQTATTGLTTFTGTVEAGVVKKTGGTSIQYMMADGSVLSQSASSGNSNFYLYKSHTNTPTPPPNAGFVYYNNAIQKNATIIYISHLTEDNIDIEIFFQNLSTLNEVYIQQKILSDNFIKYNITGIPTVVTGSHISIPVAVTSFGGTGETSFGTNEHILVSFFTNNLEVDTRLSNLETKTQNQTAISGTTTITGAVSGVSSLTSATSKLNITLSESTNDKIAFTKNTNEVAKITGISSTTVSNLVSTYGAPSLMIGLRKLNQAYTGFCVNVTDTVITTDIGFDQNGILDFSTFSALTGTVYVNTWYDQSGYGRNCDGFLINTVKPILTFTGGIPSITFGAGNGNYFQCTATCTELGLDNPNHSIITTMRSSTVNTNIMFLHGSSVEGRNEIHTNPASFGARVIDDLGAGFSDFGSSGSFTNAQTHVLVAGALNVGTQQSAGRGDLLPTVSVTTNQLSTPLASFNIGVRFSGLYGGSLFPFIGSINEMIIFPTSWIFDSISYTNYYNSMISYRTTGTNYYDGNGLVMNNNRIIELATPIANTDAANKSYVDGKAGNQTATTGLTTFTGGLVMTATNDTFRPPKLTILQIGSLTPIAGDVVYSIQDNNLIFYNGTEWRVLTTTVYIPVSVPVNITGLAGWFDASNLASLSQTPGNITQWNDMSGNGFHLTNTSAVRPQTGTATINGKNVAVFNANVIYNTGSIVNYYQHTIIIVSTIGALDKDIYGSGGVLAGNVLFMTIGGVYRAHSWRTGDTISKNSVFAPSTAVSIRIQRVSATILDIIENGNGKIGTFAVGGTDPAVSKGIFIGSRDTTTLSAFSGSMAEVLVYNKALSNIELNTVGNYLGSKWGITWTNIP